MPRLIYNGDTTDSFGRFLPTPIIERVKISSVPTSSPITTQMTEYSTSARGEANPAFAFIPEQLAEIEIRLSALFNTNDTFDSMELFEELFEKNENNSLYINFIVLKDSNNINGLKEDKNKLSIARKRANSGLSLGNTSYSPLMASSGDLKDYALTIFDNVAQVYSVPLSDYITVENFTSDFDENSNPILKSSYVNFRLHIKDFTSLNDLTLFAAISTEEFSVLADSNLSKPAFAINFSDISYEDIIINGKISKFGDPVYVNVDNLPYPNTPLMGLDGKYYKSDNISHFYIKSVITEITNKFYKQAATQTDSLSRQANNIEYVLVKYGDTVELLPNLYKANNLSPSKSAATKVGRMFDELRIAINNLNSTLLGEEQVVRRIYRNYKLTDQRALPEIIFGTSFDELSDVDFLYENVLHSNVARYVPISDSMSYPGQAEIPITPEEARAGIDDEVDNLVNQLKTAIEGTVSLNLSNFQFSTDQLRREEDDLQEFLSMWPKRWTGNKTMGTFYDDVGRNNNRQEKKVKKDAEEDNAEYSALSTKQFKEMQWWFERDMMFEFVVKEDGPPGHGGASWSERFDINTKKLCTMYPPIGMVRNTSGAPYYINMKISAAGARNWSAEELFEKLFDHINDTHGSQDPIQNSIESMSSTFTSLLESKIRHYRTNPSELSQLSMESSREEIALNLWNEFTAEILEIAYSEMSTKFDALIRCVYWSDPGMSVTQDPQYMHLANAGGADYGTVKFPYNKFANLATKRTTSEWYYPIQLGSRIADALVEPIYALKNDFLTKFEAMLERILVIEGSGIDDGTFNALSSFDIIVAKAGYFFFDFEKYVRKRSHMSRYIDVDTFLDFFPKAQEITNNCMAIRKAEYDSLTYKTKFTLNIGETNGTTRYDPSSPKYHIFNTIPAAGAGASGAPMAYHKVPVASALIRYQDFFDSVGTENNFDTDFYESLQSSDEYSFLAMRNYGFPGFNDGDITGTWAENYRLALFSYNFFIDDDKYNLQTTTVDGTVGPITSNSSRDIAEISIHVDDNSLECMTAIIEYYKSVYRSFIANYYTKAIESCSFNEYSNRFNNFFTEAILSEYPESDPWIDMVATYIMYISIFSDFFNNTSYGDRVEFGDKILEQIRPETGTINQLIEFNEKLQSFEDRLNIILNELSTDEASQNIVIRNIVDIEAPVLDHIGDYSTISTRLDS
ncbi:MAG: hypothetical protein CML45_00610 [Rhodobacteraceae bacterium]|nr:hypothetical protein [Paracoccaceae bacterium]